MPLSGRSGEIADAALVSSDELARSMRVQDSPELDREGEDNFAEPLGLRCHQGSTGATHSYGRFSKPTVLEGKREGRQVFVRIGWLGDGPPLYFLSFRMNRLRIVSALRVEAPEFQLSTSAGRLVGGAGTPPAVATLIAGLSPSSAVWRDLHVVSGLEGIVASRRMGRPAGGIGYWIYDLWLLERLADELDAQPLGGKRLTRDWTVPYALGERLPTSRR